MAIKDAHSRLDWDIVASIPLVSERNKRKIDISCVMEQQQMSLDDKACSAMWHAILEQGQA
jgi:hypothetical protein